MKMAYRLVSAMALTVCLALSSFSTVAADEADGTIKFEAQNVGIGVNINWGAGTLTLKDGSTHSFSIEGLQLVGIGYAKLSAHGDVSKLNKLEDFNGTYTAAGAGAALVKGKSIAIMANSAGVELRLETDQEGVQLSAGAGGLTFKLKE